jgi:hypothetical protein
MQTSDRWLPSRQRGWRAWTLVGVTLLGQIALGLAADRFYGSINRWLDSNRGWVMEHTKPVLLWILDHPLVWLVIILGGMVVLEFSLRFYRSLQLAAVGVPSFPSVTPIVEPKPPRPSHNVQCLGVEAGEKAARIGFINVVTPNQEVGNFHRARLKVRYSLAHSGKEVALVFPARWIGSDEDEISVEFVPQYAVLAVYVSNQWHGVKTVEVFTPQSEIESYYRRELTPLPNAHLRIEATLIGENNLSLVPFTGILALGENGTASFSADA